MPSEPVTVDAIFLDDGCWTNGNLVGTFFRFFNSNKRRKGHSPSGKTEVETNPGEDFEHAGVCCFVANRRLYRGFIPEESPSQQIIRPTNLNSQRMHWACNLRVIEKDARRHKQYAVAIFVDTQGRRPMKNGRKTNDSFVKVLREECVLQWLRS